MLDKSKRVIIVDFNHMAHMFSYSGLSLSVTKKINGSLVTLDTTIANSAIKNIWKWSKWGTHPTVICFDRPCPSRKMYFKSKGDSDEYKGKRESMSSTMFDGVAVAQRILEEAGVSCLYKDNWEADDLIFLAIHRAKQDYPDHYIDVITNDADLLPLVDERVSVFLRSKRFTFAESPSLEKTKYIQVTPRNYQEVVENLSAFRNVYVPYNSLLIYKVARGDSSDNIPNPYPPRTMTPTRLSSIVWQMKNGKLKSGYSVINKKGNILGIKDDKTKEEWIFYPEDGFYEEDPAGVSERCFLLDEGGSPFYIDIENIFRYSLNDKKYKENGQYVDIDRVKFLVAKAKSELGDSAKPKDLLAHVGLEVVYEDNRLVKEMWEALTFFGFTDEEANIFVNQYRGMNLAQAYANATEETSRNSIKIGKITNFDGKKLDYKAAEYKINLPMYS